MYRQGEPFVGARVWIAREYHYYDVIAVYKTKYKWKSSTTGNTYTSANQTFMRHGEEPYYTPTDCLKALKNNL